MASFFVPYSGSKPAAMNINGHKLLILSRDPTSFEESLDLVGADRVKKVRGGETKEEEERLLSRLAQTAEADLVIAPTELDVGDVIKNLESQLPWIQ